MTEQETREKIVGVLFPELKKGKVSCNEDGACDRCWFPCEVQREAERLAEVLIAEDIGDVSEWKHRAEVAERALQKFAEYITCEDCPFFSDRASPEKMGYPIHSYHCFSEYLKQAEEELAEDEQ